MDQGVTETQEVTHSKPNETRFQINRGRTDIIIICTQSANLSLRKITRPSLSTIFLQLTKRRRHPAHVTSGKPRDWPRAQQLTSRHVSGAVLSAQYLLMDIT